MQLIIRHQTVAAFVTTIFLSLILTLAASAQHSHRQDHFPNVMEYLDRLDRPERDQDQNPTQVVEALRLKSGMIVADLGAGSGYFTRRFAEVVTEMGKIYVIDVESEALKYVETSLAHLDQPFNAEFILAQPDNPKLPVSSVDLIFLCNTYHHLENRTTYFHNVTSALRPGGRIAIIDYYHDARSGELSFPKTHLVPRDVVVKELAAAGYELLTEHTFLSRQYFLEFAL